MTLNPAEPRVGPPSPAGRPATVLVPLDGSALARRAIPYAADLARRLSARLILLHAYAARPRAAGADPELDVVMAMSELASDLRREGVPTTTWLSYDESGPAVVQTIADLKADLLVMSTHGRGGLSQLLFGSIAEYVVRHSTTPVVLVTERTQPRWPAGSRFSVVVPLDGTPFAEHALPPARMMAAAFDADLVLVRTPEPPITPPHSTPSHWSEGERRALDAVELDLERVAGPLRAGGLRVVTRGEAGAPAAAIAEVANELWPSLAVMATHARGALSRLLLETVAAETLRRLAAPVMLIRPTSPPGGPPAPPAADEPDRA